jgi:hypothetical protein
METIDTVGKTLTQSILLLSKYPFLREIASPMYPSAELRLSKIEMLRHMKAFQKAGEQLLAGGMTAPPERAEALVNEALATQNKQLIQT